MITKNISLHEAAVLGSACNKCGHCCKYGSGVLADDDAKKIAKFLGISEEKLRKEYLEEIEKYNTKRVRPKLLRKGKLYGACVFYDVKKGCAIHEVKPLQCKTGNCSEHGEALSIWFMLNYFVDSNDPESIRQFAAYLKSGGKTLQGGNLEDFVADKKQLKKMLAFETLK